MHHEIAIDGRKHHQQLQRRRHRGQQRGTDRVLTHRRIVTAACTHGGDGGGTRDESTKESGKRQSPSRPETSQSDVADRVQH